MTDSPEVLWEGRIGSVKHRVLAHSDGSTSVQHFGVNEWILESGYLVAAHLARLNRELVEGLTDLYVACASEWDGGAWPEDARKPGMEALLLLSRARGEATP